MVWFIIAMLELLIILGIILINYKYLSGIRTVMKNADLISNGKLDMDDIRTYGDNKNSADGIANALNSIKNNLLTFIRASKTNVVTLTNAVTELSASVESNREGNGQIADEAGNVANKTSKQFEIVKDNLSIIEDNHSYMQEIDSSIAYIEKLIQESNVITRDGLTTIAGYQKDMDAMSAELSKINGILTEFNNEITKISNIGDFIIDINEELILLALNASIEAARAGQAGRGFAVVADQMNEMSVQTREGMDSINEILKEIIDSSNQVNESIQHCENTYNSSKITFDKVSRSFEVINQQSLAINQRMHDITSKFKTLSDNTNISQNKAQDLYETSEAISDSTNDIANISQIVSNESSKIGENTQTLESMLMGLQRLLVQFNTSVVPVRKDRSKRVKIMAFSMLDNPFWYGVRNGIYYAMTELSERNVDVEYIPINAISELPDKICINVQRAIDEGYDGIAFPGFINDANTLFKEAIAKGIKVVSYNCECNRSIPRHAVCMPDINELGTTAAIMCGRHMPKGGKLLILNGNPEVDTNRIKHDRFVEHIRKKKNISVVADIMCDDTADSVHKITLSALNQYPDINMIYVVLGYPLAAASAIEESNCVGKVSMIGFDHSQEIFQYIKKGIISCAVGQDDFSQGHDPIVWLYNNIVNNDPFPNDGFIRCKSTIADSSNINSLLDA
ncbi:MAG: substrate-binding domain-containing protein [Lachnospiraceae bacterium]|nr:substrate-binding domain-containing protein [Lachnospiraceae bacterium]